MLRTKFATSERLQGMRIFDPSSHKTCLHDAKDKMTGRALRLIRVFHEVSVTDLAAKLKISRSYLSEIERGKKEVQLHLVEGYAKHFRVPVSAIVFFAEQLNQRDRHRTRFEFRQSIYDKVGVLLQLVDRFEEKQPSTN